MKEDILEQLVDDYLKYRGYFTVHNVKFQPSSEDPNYLANDDRVPSDIDVVGYHPKLSGPDKVWVVSCKSWQQGFSPRSKIIRIEKDLLESRRLRNLSGRDQWKSFRELAVKKWSDALINRIAAMTGSESFTYVTAVTSLKGDASIWEDNLRFKDNLRGNPIKIITLTDLLKAMYTDITKSVAPSQVGRLLQVIKASGWKP